MINLAFHTVFIVSHAAGNYSQTLQCIKEQSTHQAESPVQWGSYRCSKVQHFSVSYQSSPHCLKESLLPQASVLMEMCNTEREASLVSGPFLST